MRSLFARNLLVGIALTCGVSSIQAQLYGPVVPPTPVVPDAPLPPPQVVPAPPPAIVPVRPLTVNEFAASFQPLPGRYEVLLIHPKTGCPVKVCFTLPPGCLRGMRVTGHKIVFDYKCQHDVVIRFLHFGKVWVRG